MKRKNFYLRNNFRKLDLKKSSTKNLLKRYNKILLEVKNDIKDSTKTLNVLNKNFRINFKIRDLEKFKKFKTIAIVGMGGSILGSEAIYNFLKFKIKKQVYFFDDLDEKKIIRFKKNKSSSKILFILISKSGNTIETLANTFLLKILKKKAKNIIIISEKENFLHTLSRKLNLFHIEHNAMIGGRFSVLSEVGLVPLYLMGLNIRKLRSKILDNLKNINKTRMVNDTINLAQSLKSQNKSNLILLNYSPELEKFLFWLQQLIAESLGKDNKGFLPIISSAPKDHHSLLQLYLDGPRDKIFNIFSLDKISKEKINVSKTFGVKSFLDKKRISKVKNAQKNALIKTLLKKKIPFREFKIKNINEEELGKLFSFFMIETVIIGKILKINPFNQPAVEQVKIYTKKLLN